MSKPDRAAVDVLWGKMRAEVQDQELSIGDCYRLKCFLYDLLYDLLLRPDSPSDVPKVP